MTPRGPGSFGSQLKALREAAGFTQEELAAIAGLSVHAVSALERGERRRPHFETVRALSAALDLAPRMRDALVASARPTAHDAAVDELSAESRPLPLPLTGLLGRDRDLELLGKWLANPEVRLITLIGPGGVGKTRLALELAASLTKDPAVRVTFASLAAIRDAAFIASAIAEALGLTDVTERELSTRVCAAYHDSPAVLLLDNFEHVLAAAPLVADLLTSVASLRVLVTSRAPLHLRGERVYVVGPLALEAGAEAMAPADLARVPAVRLFLERVRDVQPAFQLTSMNGPVVVAICRRLDALPLALELAAPWIKALSAEGLLLRLEENVLLSTAGPRDLPERQHSMNATVAWSFQLLALKEQRLFRRLGALPGRFPIEAAAAVLAGRAASGQESDDVLGALAGLIDRSLLLRAESAAPARPLYRMLETVRAYAARELAAAGERDDALEGLTRYCMREASLAAEGLAGPAQVEWLDRMHDDVDNYRAALGWLIEHRRPSEASGIAFGLMFFWLIRGHATEGLRWYEQILSLRPLPPDAEAKALLGASSLWYTQGRLERARTAIEHALASDLSDTGLVALGEIVLGHVEYAAGNVGLARDRFTESLVRFRALSIPWGVANTLSGLALVALATGDAAHAERLLDEATSELRQAGPWFSAMALYVRAMVALRLGNSDQAIAFVRESLIRIRELEDKFAFVQAMVPLAAAAVLRGDDVWVARILGARDAVTERVGAALVDRAVQDLREQAERDARARLGADRWAKAYAAGRRSSIDALLKDVDGALDTP